MISIENQHFSLNRILLLAIGLWPYQQTRLAQLHFILFFGILISFVIFQLTLLMTAKCTFNIVIKILSSTIFFSIYVIKYNAFWINSENVKCLLEQLQYTCNELKDQNEIAIIEKYGYITKRYTTILTLCAMCGIFIAIIQPMWPRILGTFLLLNESRSRRALIATEYFIDEEKYFYLIVLHINAAISIGTITITAIGTIFVGYFKHVCGMFRIASYRIEQAMAINYQQNISLDNEIMIYKYMIYAIDIHRKAMNYSQFLMSSFDGSFLLLTVFYVICLSLNFFRICQIVSFGEDMEEILIHFSCVIVILACIFVANYTAQEIIDHNNHVFTTVYNVQWYVTPLQVQKLILFLLQRGTKTFKLTICGLIVVSLENATTLTSAAISYFTVLYSTRQ